MRSLRVTSLAAATFTLTILLTSACNYRSAMGNIVATAAGEGGAATSAAPQDAQEGARQGAEFRWRGALAAGRVVEVSGINGDVRAEGTSGGEVEVVATKHGRRSVPETVRVEVVPHADGVTICAVYPSPDANKPNTCEPGGGRSNVRDNDVRVDFVVRVPAGVRFSGRTVNGVIEAESLAANVQARTVNGGIKVSTTGYAEATTVNGSITAAMGNTNWERQLEFTTVNGGINLSFPESLSADVQAETLNGDIHTDFQLTLRGRISRRKFEAQIGGGGRALRLKTINGDIEIRRAS